MEKIIVVNPQEFQKTKQKIKEKGADELHILSDFDRTLTYGKTPTGEKTQTVISRLRSDPKYLGEDYSKKAHELFDLYHPIEINLKIPLQEKKLKMEEWWKKHFDLISNSGLTKKIIQQVIEEKPIHFRKGTKQFLERLNKKSIPLIILSAGPGDMIKGYLEKDNLNFENIEIIGNQYEFDEAGKTTKVKGPIIHTFNKDETSLPAEVLEKIKLRKNVILLGDSIGDVGMIEGFNYDNLTKIGFLNEEVKENLEEYKKHFDIILTKDQDFNFVNKLLKEILK